jgi:hypothetical protein
MKRSESWEADVHLAGQGIFSLLWNYKVHYLFYIIPPLDPKSLESSPHYIFQGTLIFSLHLVTLYLPSALFTEHPPPPFEFCLRRTRFTGFLYLCNPKYE